MSFKRATRTAVKLKVLLTGPSGAGKTFGALHLGDGIAPGSVAVIDSENDRSAYYADSVVFDTLSLTDHRPAAYIAAIDAAVEAGYGVVVIDSLSHAWQDILERKERYDRENPRSNSFTNWRMFSAEWERLVRHILDAPVHVIATARSKQAYEQIEQDGRKRVLKVGVAPIAKDGLEFEFSLHFDLLASHKAQALKDNTARFDRGEGTLWDLCDGTVPRMLREWLRSAAAPAHPEAATAVAIEEAIMTLPDRKRAAARKRWAVVRAKGVSEGEAQTILTSLRGLTASDVTPARYEDVLPC